MMWHNYGMRRTTIMADEELLEQLRAIAREERRPLAAIIREGLEWRALQQRPGLRFLGIGASSEPTFDTAKRSADMPYAPRTWR